jgi:hypothetical protein
LSDAQSRYRLRCQAVARPDDEHVRPIFEAAFREHGLPLAIRLPKLATGSCATPMSSSATSTRSAAAQPPSAARFNLSLLDPLAQGTSR